MHCFTATRGTKLILSSSAYSGLGRGGSSLSRDAKMPLTPDTSSHSGQLRYLFSPVCPWSASGVPSWNSSLGWCPRAFRNRCQSHLSILLSMRSSISSTPSSPTGWVSFSPYLWRSTQPPCGGNSFWPLVSAIVLVKVHDHMWDWECRLTGKSSALDLDFSHQNSPVHQQYYCGGFTNPPVNLTLFLTLHKTPRYPVVQTTLERLNITK